MHILHIASDFIATKVHVSLFSEIANNGVNQTVYCPIRDAKLVGSNVFVAEGTNIVYDCVVKPFHRYFYHIKRQGIFQSLQKKVNLKEVDLCHAATLLTDGGQAYKIYKKYHIPYVVAVRNTDINGFFDKAPNTWIAARRILLNAKKIFFISQALMDKFSNHKVVKSILPKIKERMFLIPNGIDDYFLDHVNRGSRAFQGNTVVYVGNFSRNKNVLRLCEAVKQLRDEVDFRDIKLTLVGGGGRDADESVGEWIENHKEIVDFVGPIYEKDKLCEIFSRNSVFAMPSIHETFGLVYIEALSQNIPVVFTKGQGIDGFFPPSIGVGVNPLSTDGIKNALSSILYENYKFSNDGIDFELFRWENIANNYIRIYNQIINENENR